jgi:uncharacterized protein (UPF0216 family)
MVDQLAIEKLIQSMNRHIPAKRSSLEQLLELEEPNYRGKDGTEYSLEREELEKIASLLDERERRKLRLPIYISTDTTYPGGAWKIRGRIEVKVVSNLIKREPEKDDEMRLFFPHVNDLRKILPTATTVLYMP